MINPYSPPKGMGRISRRLTPLQAGAEGAIVFSLLSLLMLSPIYLPEFLGLTLSKAATISIFVIFLILSIVLFQVLLETRRYRLAERKLKSLVVFLLLGSASIFIAWPLERLLQNIHGFNCRLFGQFVYLGVLLALSLVARAAPDNRCARID